ncbi:helix-turn-helix transcriptional regulator [Streptomyces sp. SID3343]|uniref:helix-turn-helix transcriptional regulator n=1 Tax=Streptomyces sp. SID3343 TaxID=2690260 RepID=UPI001371A3F5|nr:helix-turn-helix transcriptional regulator [Streptomyces sp. SID3343]MYW02732.1 helix-turn-helix domain-containing protein [Streptomyces sp. SID3343]
MTDRPARELADFLRSRRDRLQPADVDLPAGTRRRTRGLRREEVAHLAAISTTYYTFLEQGRDVRPSRQVLNALGHALRLAPTELAHLHRLAHGAPSGAPVAAPETLAPAVAALVDRLDPYPTYVTGRCFDVLAANRAARALWTDWRARPPEERNIVWWTLAAPEARTTLVDWEFEARSALARFRIAADRNPGDPDFTALVQRLRTDSAEADRWWPEHDVHALGSGKKRLSHPKLGVLDLEHVVLQVADTPDHKLVTFTTHPTTLTAIAALPDTH